MSGKLRETWYSSRLERDVTVARWGQFGVPILMFSTAGGDAEEIERFLVIETLRPHLEQGRIKVYSVDSIAGQSWTRDDDPRHSMWLQHRFGETIHAEVVPAIRSDCATPHIEIVTAGASIGAFNAVASLCRFPDAFRVAIGMSGTYDLSDKLGGHWNDDFYFSSPLHFLPALPEDSAALATLRRRFVVLPTGEGAWEEPAESWKAAHALGSRGVPNRVDLWGPDYRHDWPTWRDMLPKYLDELLDEH